ncbi:MAG: hypothetical protein HKN71_09920 [Gemmatimonadetes bacterium]|nr:hypothetical protein [Gemmatimonadota bacterium]
MRRAQARGPDAARVEGIAIAREVREAVAALEPVAGVHVGTPGADVGAALEVLAP